MSKPTTVTTKQMADEMEATLLWWIRGCKRGGCERNCTKDAIVQCRRVENAIRAAIEERARLREKIKALAKEAKILIYREGPENPQPGECYREELSREAKSGLRLLNFIQEIRDFKLDGEEPAPPAKGE